MVLKDFINNFIIKNTLIRIWTSDNKGNRVIKSPTMEWELIKDDTYSRCKVIGVTDILVLDDYIEAVNIIIDNEYEK